jgi:hypothetical protein
MTEGASERAIVAVVLRPSKAGRGWNGRDGPDGVSIPSPTIVSLTMSRAIRTTAMPTRIGCMHACRRSCWDVGVCMCGQSLERKMLSLSLARVGTQAPTERENTEMARGTMII